jgi:curved DNA-binding protein
MSGKDPYEILGVPRTASQEEIKRVYRRLAKETHPDRNPGDKNAEKRFKEVRAAYEVLGDPQRRAQYDRFGAGGPTPEFHTWTTGGGGTPFEDIRFDFGSLGDLSSIFEQFFSRGGERVRPRSTQRRVRPRGADLEHGIELSFEEAWRGTTREVVLTGAGRGGEPERIEVHIPPGVRDGQRIRVRGKGQAGPGGRGNLLIHCRVRPHPFYRCEGADIVVDLPLTLAEATFGTKVGLPTPDGPTVVTVPPGTSSGTKLRLRGRGLHRQDGGTGAETRGDLLAIVRIQAPKDVSPRARQLLEELDRELAQRPRAHWPP